MFAVDDSSYSSPSVSSAGAGKGNPSFRFVLSTTWEVTACIGCTFTGCTYIIQLLQASIYQESLYGLVMVLIRADNAC